MELLERVIDWRKLFDDDDLIKAKDIVLKQNFYDFVFNDDFAKVKIGKYSQTKFSSVLDFPKKFSDNWSTDDFNCSCKKATKYYWEQHKNTCEHEAALLMLCEQLHGPWKFKETEAEREQRLINEKNNTEYDRREKLKKKMEGKSATLLDFLKRAKIPKGKVFFNIFDYADKVKTNEYCVQRALKLYSEGKINMEEPGIAYSNELDQDVNAPVEIEDEFFSGLKYGAHPILRRKGLEVGHCLCKSVSYYDRFYTGICCEHELVAIAKLYEYVLENDPGDYTDRNALDFFEALEDSAVSHVQENEWDFEGNTKIADVVLSPYIVNDAEKPKLAFKIGKKNGKLFMLKGFRNFENAVANEGVFGLGKNDSVDFSKEELTEESIPWLSFIRRRINETDTVNDRIARKTWGSGSTVSVLNKETLEGATLDKFYDIALNTKCEYKDTKENKTGVLYIGHRDLRVNMNTKKITDDEGNVLGIEVYGNMPIILQGSEDSYILGTDYLSRITKEETLALYPFERASKSKGEIRFSVGKEKLAEFYYRVVPELEERSGIIFDDSCYEEIKPVLPPEPVFSFKMDMDGDYVKLEATVKYDEKEYSFPKSDIEKSYTDIAQEQRVDKAIRKYIGIFNDSENCYIDRMDDDSFFRLITEGVAELSGYGIVEGTDDFYRPNIRSMPSVKVGVSLDSGLMDISVISKDISSEELLEILESYKHKKKYHRLSSGDYITLSRDESIDALEDMAGKMEIPLEELVKNGAEVPSYRALYLEHILESHEELASNREKTYRTLIKNFRTVKDADYELSKELDDTLRPYQVYGYKWLRTIAAAGFGGILADEMGLGKTLEAISFMEMLKKEGMQKPALVVCPASLVYNWLEEIHRFAPSLSAKVISGTLSARKKIFAELNESPVDVIITSYDLLRKDITLYDGMCFGVSFLDEAQYIKNRKAAMTKAVKAIKADVRFALTGTPIENRLSELWSIFDYLMPGFLYKYDDFSVKYEIPVMKDKNAELTEKLRQMVGPFILRRLKKDVLKDLPEKLEEVRYVKFEDKQRKVYDGQIVHMKQLLENGGNSGEDKIRIFSELTRLRQICCDPSLFLENYDGESAKRLACMELVQNAIGGGHRMLIFSQFTSMLELLEEDLQKEDIPYYVITGSTPKEKRVRMVKEFNEGDVPVFLVSLKAGGTGLNLVGADIVIHYDPWWNMAAQNQATDRAHRIGQKNKVTVYRMIIKDSIEEKILDLQEAKRELANQIIEGNEKSIYSMSSKDLLELLS